jgi:hypothetical protein
VSAIRHISYPKTEPPPSYVQDIADIFIRHESEISTSELEKGLKSDDVLKVISNDLMKIGFEVEGSKKDQDKIHRPVFFGENGIATLTYQVDAYHDGYRCGLEVEAGRATMGNAVYRDFVLAMVMVQVDHFVLAVPNEYKYYNKGKRTTSADYAKTEVIADMLYAHSRVNLPYKLTLIGY